MGIMPAGVHHTVAPTSVFHLFGVVDVQGVNVGAKCYHALPRFVRGCTQIRQHAVSVRAHAHVEPLVAQQLIQIQTGLSLVPGDFRIHVQLPPDVHHLIVAAVDLAIQFSLP